MKEKLLKLIAKLKAVRHSMHERDGKPSGITAYGVTSFAVVPEIVALLKGSALGWVCIANERDTVSNNGNLLPPKVYIGLAKGGAIEDVGTHLDSVEF